MSLELWNEGSEHATNPTEHRCKRLAIEIFHELSDDLTQRRQRPAQLALVDASAGNESETMLGSARRELSEQTCLPDARLTGDQSHRGPAFSRRFDRGEHPSEFVAAPTTAGLIALNPMADIIPRRSNIATRARCHG